MNESSPPVPVFDPAVVLGHYEYPSPVYIPPTLQQVYDVVRAHLLTQGKKSTSTIGMCKYRADETPTCPVKCAAGVLIPDALYTPVMEGKSIISHNWNNLPVDRQPEFVRWVGPLKQLVSSLQQIHDSYPVTSWEYLLNQLGDKYKLTYTPTTPPFVI